MSLVANARMYAVCPAVGLLWTALFDQVARAAGVPLTVIDHAAPAPLEALWTRTDLGLAFICGYPYATGRFPVQPIAAPVPLADLGGGRAAYATHLVVAAGSGIATLAQSFGRRLGWTVAHSQSGFNAVRTHLLPHRHGADPLYGASIGPLLTPRRVIEALLSGEIDIGPLDSYWHDLLVAHEPETAVRLRVIATTSPMPMPLLAASARVDAPTIDCLRQALLSVCESPDGRALLTALRLSGFAAVAAGGYQVLLAAARAADAAGYATPG